jgi:SHS2 domain-containing protein
MKRYEALPHTADLKIRVYGNDLKELFVNAVYGMFESLHPKGIVPPSGVEGPRDVSPREREIEVRSHDLESLLVDFLSEALYCSDVYKEAYIDVKIKGMGDFYIKGTLVGYSVEEFGEGEIKAVTYHELKVEKRDGVWVAEILFDV